MCKNTTRMVKKQTCTDIAYIAQDTAANHQDIFSSIQHRVCQAYVQGWAKAQTKPVMGEMLHVSKKGLVGVLQC